MKIVVGGTDKFYADKNFSGADIFCSLELSDEDIKKDREQLEKEIRETVYFQQYQRFLGSVFDAYSRGSIDFDNVLLRIKEYKYRQEKLNIVINSKKFKNILNEDFNRLKSIIEEVKDG